MSANISFNSITVTIQGLYWQKFLNECFKIKVVHSTNMQTLSLLPELRLGWYFWHNSS